MHTFHFCPVICSQKIRNVKAINKNYTFNISYLGFGSLVGHGKNCWLIAVKGSPFKSKRIIYNICAKSNGIKIGEKSCVVIQHQLLSVMANFWCPFKCKSSLSCAVLSKGLKVLHILVVRKLFNFKLFPLK